MFPHSSQEGAEGHSYETELRKTQEEPTKEVIEGWTPGPSSHWGKEKSVRITAPRLSFTEMTGARRVCQDGNHSWERSGCREQRLYQGLLASRMNHIAQ